MLRDVIAVRWLGGHRLLLAFDDGVEGEVDLASIVEFRGVFEPLKNPAEVAKARVEPELGTVVWSSGADLDPVVLYGLVTGRPVAQAAPAAL